MPDVDVQGVSDYHGAFVSRAAAQSISHNTTTTITFTAKSYDPLSLVDIAGSPTRITLKESGIYILSAGGQWAAGTLERQILMISGGSDIGHRELAAVGVTDQCTQGLCIRVLAGAFYEMQVFQFSGASLNISGCWMKLQRVDRVADGL
jgi:hypothetical protein